MRIISLAIGLGLVSLAYAQAQLQDLPDCAVSCSRIAIYTFDLRDCILILVGQYYRKLALHNSQQETPLADALLLILTVSAQALTF